MFNRTWLRTPPSTRQQTKIPTQIQNYIFRLRWFNPIPSYESLAPGFAERRFVVYNAWHEYDGPDEYPVPDL